ncbi:MAG: DUF928 domain-containing protein [Gammaproteobacteria bacterium]|nr:DUF928 domain-containing protein [Gammaproteobacteria bacterium]NIM72704.1 DUF928 domain-containing protein [Gammaproteobacteria bacterium]NIN37762.1 DUF928 domain-containing protein [Gammaproteobacteria bacterium]NIO24465.1 DUF928 domain-containing protein [Gammaproteobacteria bacterium]NIO65068.1 DUF928 domain-containing protein [Gammaproteobacteria bacterium]
MIKIQSLGALLLGVGAAALLATPLMSPAQTGGATAKRKPALMPVYQPPMRGTTVGGRIGGGTRGTAEQPITLSVLAPEHPGLTVNPQPRLYWYLSDTVAVAAELTVIDRRKADPLLELAIAPPIQAGIHTLDLARHGVRLDPGARYEWFVALVVDRQQRSHDIVAGGEVDLVAPPAGLEGRLADAGAAGGAGVYAGAGMWYDAIDSASLRVARNPGDALARAQRAALLEQVGLAHVAAYDRGDKP